MPAYDFHCRECDTVFELQMASKDYKEPTGCPECKHEGSIGRIFTPVGMVFAGDGWATKNGRVNAQMRARQEKAGQRQRDNHGTGLSLAPNVNGEQVDSWSDAAKLASSKGKDASGYLKLAKETGK